MELYLAGWHSSWREEPRYETTHGTAIAAGLVLVLSFDQEAETTEIKKDFHESFPVARGARLDLRHGDGRVTVTQTSRSAASFTPRVARLARSPPLSGAGSLLSRVLCCHPERATPYPFLT